MAVVLIDLQAAHRHEFSYGHGTVEEGLRRTVAVIAEARSLSMPVFLVTGERHPEIIPEILEAAGKGRRIFEKKMLSAFSSLDLLYFLNEVDTLVVGGWARHLCVRETVLDALGEGYSIMTSDQLVFGKHPSDEPMLGETYLRGFGDQLYLYRTSEDLTLAMRKAKLETEGLKRKKTENR
jgi:nicotinamidase-related amidase